MAPSFYFILFFTSLRNKLAFTPDQRQEAIKLTDYFRNKGYDASLKVLRNGNQRSLVLMFHRLYPEDWIIIKKDPYLRSKLYDGVIAAVYGIPAEFSGRFWYLGPHGEEPPGQPHYP